MSWDVMLQDCMNMQVVANHAWLLLPLAFIIVAVLCQLMSVTSSPADSRSGV